MTIVWEKLMAYIGERKEDQEIVAEMFNEMLDDLGGDDFFGTERQCDPRGDWRD